MPLTILFLFILGYYFIGLSLSSAFLLAAVLSPTDPVLARSVQVDGPNEGDENDVNVSLTSEAGLNDGLAFPFVYFAISLIGINSISSPEISGIALNWFLYDFSYRIVLGLIIGATSGYVLSKVIMSKHGDANKDGENAGLILLASVFLTYGITEIFDGYGFLGVFIAALVGKKNLYNQNKPEYAKLPHMFSDQFEKIMMAVLLLWVGYYSLSGALNNLTYQEFLTALALIFIIRPISGYIALIIFKGSNLKRLAISIFGIRGIGSLYYLAYAQNADDFINIDSIWRVVLVCIIMSIVIHGISSKIIMKKIEKAKI